MPNQEATAERPAEVAAEIAADIPVEGNWLFDRLPPWVMDTLTTEQKEAIHDVVADPTWSDHPVNVRLSMPWFGRSFYMTVVAGREKRGKERRKRERSRYPVRTVANIFFFIGLVTLFYMLALVGLALHSAILEF